MTDKGEDGLVDPLTTAKAVSVAAVGEAAPEVRGLLQRLLGPMADVYGARLKDWALERQRKNLERIAAKAAAKVPVSPGALPQIPSLPFRTVIALLEGASLEDEDAGLEEEWTGLLASAAAGIEVPTVYPAILSQMTPRDARVLSALDSAAPAPGATCKVSALGQATGTVGDALMESLDNLLRLRVCALTVPQTGQLVRRSDLWPLAESGLEITFLGRSFLRACRGPKS